MLLKLFILGQSAAWIATACFALTWYRRKSQLQTRVEQLESGTFYHGIDALENVWREIEPSAEARGLTIVKAYPQYEPGKTPLIAAELLVTQSRTEAPVLRVSVLWNDRYERELYLVCGNQIAQPYSGYRYTDIIEAAKNELDNYPLLAAQERPEPALA